MIRISKTFVHNPRKGSAREMYRIQRKVNRYATIGYDEDGEPEEVNLSYWDEVTEPIPGTRGERRAIYFDTEEEASAFASKFAPSSNMR